MQLPIQLTPRHLLDHLRFPPAGTKCGRCGITPIHNGGSNEATVTYRGKHYCPFHSPVGEVYVPCTKCGEKPVVKALHIEEDPVCDDCIRLMIDQAKDQADREEMMPGYNPMTPGPHPRITTVYEFSNDEGGCPGWNDSCGNTIEGDADLCPDCTMGRLNAQSPLPGTDRRNYC